MVTRLTDLHMHAQQPADGILEDTSNDNFSTKLIALRKAVEPKCRALGLTGPCLSSLLVFFAYAFEKILMNLSPLQVMKPKATAQLAILKIYTLEVF